MKRFFSFIMVMLTLSVVTMSLTSCDPDSWNIFNAKLIKGDPWIQDGFEIRHLGGDKYEIYDVKKQLYHTEYLDPFWSYESSIPEELWPEEYKPYYNTFYGEICWYVYGHSSDFLILKNGNIARL